MFRFAKKLNIQNYVNWRRNYVHYICIECLDLQKNWISRTPKIQREILYIIYIYIRNVWICRKIESLELRKFNGKLCTLYVCNVWICRKIECPELHKFNGKLCTLYVRNIWIWRKIECLELRKFNGKLCTLYVRNVWICRTTKCPNYGSSTGNCVHYMYRLSGFTEKLNL